MNDRELLLREIRRLEADYNPTMQAIRQPFSSPGYHTTLTEEIGYVHPTRFSAYYALALLDAGEEALRDRAFAVLERLIRAQDTERTHPTFGIWPWFYEEPLERMSPPDWNWADFIGKPLVLVLKRHSRLLPAGLRLGVEAAVQHACQAIMKRNVGPEYTNIAIMGAFVTMASGEYGGDPVLEDYGRERFQRFYDFTMEQGTFQEFNSPTYTTVAIEELTSIRTETGNGTVRSQADRLLDLAWAMVAERFHPGTKQWAGPHARAYSDLLAQRVQSFLQYGLGGELELLPEEELHYNTMWYGNPIACPEQYRSLFRDSRTEHKVESLPGEIKGGTVQAATYLTERYSLGTFSLSFMWNQRRSLIAYAASQTGPAYLRLRVLHDGYDYTGAWQIAAQWKNHVLFGLHFCTDGGDRHPNLDPIREGTIAARDLRVRIEIGGALDRVEIEEPADVYHPDGLRIRTGDTVFRLGIRAARFHGISPGFVTVRGAEAYAVDLILYEGERKDFCLKELHESYVVGQLAVDEPLPACSLIEGPDDCEAITCPVENSASPELRITLPLKPAATQTFWERSESAVEGEGARNIKDR